MHAPATPQAEGNAHASSKHPVAAFAKRDRMKALRVTSTLGVLSLLLPTGGAESSGGGAAGPPSAVDLRAELRAAEAKVAALKRLLQEEPSTNHGTADRLAGTSSCAPPPDGRELGLPLPRGSYNRTCIGCVRWSESVQCACLQRDAVDPSRTELPPGNVSGMWAADDGMELKLQMLPPGSSSVGILTFRILCLRSPATTFVGNPGCTPRLRPRIVEPGRVPSWYGGTGTLLLGNHSAVVHLDNGQVARGWFNATAQSFHWHNETFRSHGHKHSVPAQTWLREPQSGRIKTSISLSACKNFSRGAAGSETQLLLTNEDGHLFCDWRRVPPPRVGRLIDSQHLLSSSLGRSGGDLPLRPPAQGASCRVLDHVSFVAPQFKYPADPLLMQPSINVSTLRNSVGGDLANISGIWTSFRDDGSALQIMQVRGTRMHTILTTLVIMIIISSSSSSSSTDKELGVAHCVRTEHLGLCMQNDQFKVVEWYNRTEWPQGLPTQLRGFRITCVDGGDYGTCSDSVQFAANGEAAGWHTGTCVSPQSRGVRFPTPTIIR